MTGRLALSSSMSGETRVVSILSGKGGVGKSVIAYNLADALSASGHRVLLVDNDFTGANQAILANAPLSNYSHGYVRGERGLSESVTRLRSNFDLLAAAPVEKNLLTFTDRQIARFASRLHSDAASYAFVILDHASGVHSHLDILAHASHLNLLIVVPELTSIADGYGLYKHLLSFKADFEARLILNRVGSIEDRDALYTKFRAITEKFLGQFPRLFGTVPESPDITKSVSAQLPVRLVAPESVARQAFARLANNLVAGQQLVAGQPTQSTSTDYELRTTADIRK